jgi:3',5'-cyclic AMP phosphodiesterase CpdA
MSVMLQISDPHFGTEQAPVVAALQQLHTEQRPDLIIVSGDITQRARRAQFQAAQKFFTELKTPSLIIPGNHDIPLFNLPLRMFAPYANYTKAFGNNLQPEFISDDLFVIGLNTTRPQRHIDGEVSTEQIEYVCARLSSAHDTQLKIVVTHQPVHVITPADATNLLHNYREALDAWALAGVDLLMGGHIHLPYVRSLRESHSNFAHAVWVVQAGTALSSRVRGGVPNSVNIIRYDQHDQRQCSVEQWNFAWENRAFHLAVRTELDLAHD